MEELIQTIKAEYEFCRILDNEETEKSYYLRFIYNSAIYIASKSKRGEQVLIYLLKEAINND